MNPKIFWACIYTYTALGAVTAASSIAIIMALEGTVMAAKAIESKIWSGTKKEQRVENKSN